MNEQKLSLRRWIVTFAKSFKLGSEEPWENECSSNSDATE